MGLAEEIERLEDLHAAGTLSDDEFAEAKRKVLDGGFASEDQPIAVKNAGIKDWMPPKEWCMVLHLSQLCTYLVPLAGIVAPLLIWQMLKEEVPGVDQHGKMVMNWMISAFLYAVIGALLCLVFVGIFVLIALAVISVLFPIIGALKANEGVLWEYPLTIQFIK